MRKALVFLLLASAAAPAFASTNIEAPGDRRGGQSQRAEKDDDGDRRSARRERPQRAERAERVAQPQRAAAKERKVSRNDGREAYRQQIMQSRAARGAYGQAAPVRTSRRGDAPQSVRNWRSGERFRENSPTVIQERNRDGRERLRQRYSGQQSRSVDSRVPRQGTQPPRRSGYRTSHHSPQRWSGNWRSDHRYDWRNHRRRHSSLFNFGFYRDPFGWGYQSFSIGSRMWPSYYSQNHWLNDPYQYRLPYAPPGYRWIRYYDDAILVDTWDGQVVDVIRNFFW